MRNHLKRDVRVTLVFLEQRRSCEGLGERAVLVRRASAGLSLVRRRLPPLSVALRGSGEGPGLPEFPLRSQPPS